MTGDGEWQEGQNDEALRSTVNQGITNLHVIVDANKVQSDKLVSEIGDLGDLSAKFHAFGWHVSRCDGHDFTSLAEIFSQWRGITDRPKVLIADTIKGRGVSFMEHPVALEEGNGLYGGIPEPLMIHLTKKRSRRWSTESTNRLPPTVCHCKQSGMPHNLQSEGLHHLMIRSPTGLGECCWNWGRAMRIWLFWMRICQRIAA